MHTKESFEVWSVIIKYSNHIIAVGSIQKTLQWLNGKKIYGIKYKETLKFVYGISKQCLLCLVKKHFIRNTEATCTKNSLIQANCCGNVVIKLHHLTNDVGNVHELVIFNIMTSSLIATSCGI